MEKKEKKSGKEGKEMNFIDLCAGIGGIRLGLEMAGHKCVGFCEIDKFARQSYKAMYNTNGEWEKHDITAVTDEEIRELARGRRIDIITGGFPCQSFSIAGKRRGFSDTRGTIFFEICRFIRIIRPRYFICENVKGLLSHDSGRTFGTILHTLAELGYCVEWEILNSKNFGVPQNRERVFLIGHLGDECGGKVFPIEGADGQNPCKLQEITHGLSMAYRVYDANGLSKTLASLGGGMGAKTGLYKVADGRNGVICIQKTHGDTTTVKVDETGTIQAARIDKVPNVITSVLTPDRVKKRQNGRRRFRRWYRRKILTGGRKYRHGVAIKEAKVSGIYTGVSGKYQHGPLEGLSRTLKSGKLDAGIFDGVRIRRLTPRECWRLQGFPDEYFDRAKAAGLSDTQLYKQAGNAVTVNVAAAIGRKLEEIEEKTETGGNNIERI